MPLDYRSGFVGCEHEECDLPNVSATPRASVLDCFSEARTPERLDASKLIEIVRDMSSIEKWELMSALGLMPQMPMMPCVQPWQPLLPPPQPYATPYWNAGGHWSW